MAAAANCDVELQPMILEQIYFHEQKKNNQVAECNCLHPEDKMMVTYELPFLKFIWKLSTLAS